MSGGTLDKNLQFRLSEDEIQQQIVDYLGLMSSKHQFMFFSIPNEGAMKTATLVGQFKQFLVMIVRKLKRMGMHPGAADLEIVCAGRSYFLEVKTDEGVQSRDQKTFAVWAKDCGAEYDVVRSLDDVCQKLLEWEIVK